MRHSESYVGRQEERAAYVSGTCSKLHEICWFVSITRYPQASFLAQGAYKCSHCLGQRRWCWSSSLRRVFWIEIASPHGKWTDSLIPVSRPGSNRTSLCGVTLWLSNHPPIWRLVWPWEKVCLLNLEDESQSLVLEVTLDPAHTSPSWPLPSLSIGCVWYGQEGWWFVKLLVKISLKDSKNSHFRK